MYGTWLRVTANFVHRSYVDQIQANNDEKGGNIPSKLGITMLSMKNFELNLSQLGRP